MKNHLLFVAIIIFSSAQIQAQALQEFEAVITDKKFNSSSTVVIDEAEIKRSRAKNLTALLALQANISITQSNFQPNSIYLRGGDSSHVLILVDGVPFYDASSIQRTVNLNTLDLKAIQKIEVIKGSQSVLFGGQALSGVIKITTIPKELKTRGVVTTQLGTQNSRLISMAGTYAISEKQALVARLSLSDRNNESPVLNSTKIYPTRFTGAELAHVFKGEELETTFKLQSSFDKTFIATTDMVTFKAADADNFEFSTYQLASMGSIRFTKNALKSNISVAYQQGVRLFEQQEVPMTTKQDYIGDLLATRFELQPINSQKVTLLVGGNFNEEKSKLLDKGLIVSDVATNFQGFFAKADIKVSEDFQLEVGERSDYKKWKNAIRTYQVGATLFKNFKAEYSTGFKQPSLYQLFSSFGNPDLKSEKSISSSLTYETNINPGWFYSVTGFHNEFSNLIVARGFPIKYENVSKSRSVGLEMTTGLRFEVPQIFANLSLGYQEPYDVDGATWLVRRPLRTASFKLRKEFADISAGLEMVHNGDRRDRTGATSYGTIESYTYLNVTAEYKMTEQFSIYARAQNIANHIYQTSHGFYDEGQSYVVGAEASF